MQIHDVLSSDIAVMSGAVVFKGTRVPLSVVFGNLAAGMSMDDIARNFPTVRREMIDAVLLVALHQLERHFASDHDHGQLPIRSTNASGL